MATSNGNTKCHSRGRIAGVALLLAISLYGATAAPGLLWGDSGEIQLHGFLDGWDVNDEVARSHVLHSAITRPLMRVLPFVEPARVANWVSVLFGALTVSGVAWLCATFCTRVVAVFAGTAMLALSHTLWQLSTSAEVVTLSTSLLALELICFVKLVETRRLSWLAGCFLINGLGLSNHNFALLMWPIYGFVAIRWWTRWPRPRIRTALLAFVPFVLGALPVLLLIANHWAMQGDFWVTLRSFLVGSYGPRVTNFERLPAMCILALLFFVLNFPTPLFPLFLPGLRRACKRMSTPVRAFFVGGFTVHAVFAIRYDVPDQHTFLVPTFMFVALFLAIGVDRFLEWRPSWLMRCTIVGLSLVSPAVYVVLPPILERYNPDLVYVPHRNVPHRDRFTWFLQPWRFSQRGADRFARELFSELPPNAWLVVDGTLCTPLNYLQAVEGLRRDVYLDSWVARQDWFRKVDVTAARENKLREGLVFVVINDLHYLPDWLHEPRIRMEPQGRMFRVARLD